MCQSTEIIGKKGKLKLHSYSLSVRFFNGSDIIGILCALVALSTCRWCLYKTDLRHPPSQTHYKNKASNTINQTQWIRACLYYYSVHCLRHLCQQISYRPAAAAATHTWWVLFRSCLLLPLLSCLPFFDNKNLFFFTVFCVYSIIPRSCFFIGAGMSAWACHSVCLWSSKVCFHFLFETNDLEEEWEEWVQNRRINHSLDSNGL